MARAENRHLEWANYQRRLRVWKQLVIVPVEAQAQLYFLKDTSRRCSCFICKRERYSRKSKHKPSLDE